MLRLMREERALPLAVPVQRRTVRRVSGPARALPAPIDVPAMFRLTEQDPPGLRAARRVLRVGVVAGMLAAAWQIGMVIGAL